MGQLTASILAEAFRTLACPAIQGRATALAEAMGREDGAGGCVEAFNRHLPLEAFCVLLCVHAWYHSSHLRSLLFGSRSSLAVMVPFIQALLLMSLFVVKQDMLCDVSLWLPDDAPPNERYRVAER